MSALALSDRLPALVVNGAVVFADSRDVAITFRKEHKRVLQTIREIHCSDNFRRHNFVLFKIKDLAGESTSHVEMTRDGFTFLAMGFTGREAAKWKERYIEAFNRMEAELRSREPMQALADRLIAHIDERFSELIRHRVVAPKAAPAIFPRKAETAAEKVKRILRARRRITMSALSRAVQPMRGDELRPILESLEESGFINHQTIVPRRGRHATLITWTVQ